MPRPRLRRNVCFSPEITFYKPQGVPINRLESVDLTLEEVEALRLKSVEELSQNECAEKMHISQPTFHRLILSARRKIADSIVNGKAIKIESNIII